MELEPLPRDILGVIDNAVDLQFKNSAAAFDTWFKDLDVAELLPPGLDFSNEFLTRAKDGIRSMCLLGWRARECEIMMFNIRAAAMRDVMKDTKQLRAEVEQLTAENAALRAARKDALVRRLVARRQGSGVS